MSNGGKMMEDKDTLSKISRREFIKGAALGSATLAGASALAGCGSSTAEPAGLPDKWDEEADVVVVGAGGGGLAATIEAAEAGADVAVIEVMPSALESNTAICGGVVMGAETSIQKAAGISDSIAEFKKYLTAAGGGFDDPEITNLWAEHAGETVDWLAGLGVEFPVENLYVSGIEPMFADVTPPVARGHITNAHSGRPIAETLYNTAAAKENVKFFFETRGKRLIVTPEGEIAGVEAEQDGEIMNVKAKKGVVLATAGYSRNEYFIRNFMPAMATGGSFGSQWQQGDGIRMGMGVGASLINMWCPQAATIGVPTTPDMTPCLVITIWGNPCVMVSQDAKRHFREDLYYEHLYERIAEQEGGFVWAIWDQAVTDLGGELVAVPAFSADLSTEVEKGWVKKADTIHELAQQLDVEASILESTMAAYNQNAAAGEDPDFGKEVGLGVVEKAPFYAAKTVPATCDTAGGLEINSDGHVFSVFGEVVPRLYATGSTTGGWRGKLYPGSGTAVSFTTTFGRIAGKNAAAEERWE
jgi:flavocytochrome c